MSKKHKSSQFPPSHKNQNSVHQPTQSIAKSPDSPQLQLSEPAVLQQPLGEHFPIQPEEMSLQAHQHIQVCLKRLGKTEFSKEDVTAVLRLAQHLRVFGLLSAAGYLKQAKEGKEKERKVQGRTQPIWLSLLWQLVEDNQPIGTSRELMEHVQEMAAGKNKEQSRLYFVTWRKALILSNHWNFWARAYQEEKQNDNSTEHSTPLG